MKKAIAFIPTDRANQVYAQGCLNSLRKFHNEEELPVLMVDEAFFRTSTEDITKLWYRMTPYIAKDLILDYDLVLKLDADQIITGPLTEILEDTNYDVAVVNNSNPREYDKFPYQFMNIAPLAYVNCGLIAMRSREFIQWWDNICNSVLFGFGQMREQDWLNLMVFSNNYKVKKLDEGDSFYGLAGKGYFQDMKLEGDEIVLYPQEDKWPDKKKIIKVLHWAGGNDPTKGNFRIRFQPDVVKRLEYLISQSK